MNHPSFMGTLIIALSAMSFTLMAWASGGQNAYNNPTGEPADDTYQTPFANSSDGRMMIFCAEDELLVITPVQTGVAEATCVPTDSD